MSAPPRGRARLALAAVLAALALIVVAGAAMLRGDAPRALLERRLAAATGLPVQLGGLLVRWERGLVLRAADLRIGSAPEEAPFAQVREMVAAPRLAPLFAGRVVLRRLEVRGARVRLARNPEGTGGQKRPEGGGPSALRVEHLTLDDAELAWTDPRAELQLTARIDSATDGAGRPVTRGQVQGKARDVAVRAEAWTAPVLQLAGNAAVPLRSQAQIGSTRIEADGTLRDPLGGLQADLAVQVAGPSLAALYPTLRLAVPSTPPYRLRGRLALREGVYRLDDIAGTIGASDIAGAGTLDVRAARPRLDARLTSARFALADLGAAIGVPAQPAPGGRLLPDASFDLPRMQALDADVELKATRLVAQPALAVEDLTLRVLLQDGQLRLDPLAFGFAGGTLIASITLDATRKPLAAEAAIDMRGVQLALLFPTLDTARVSAGRLGAQARLRGHGQSVAGLLGTADGTLAAAMVGGRISHTVVAAAALDGGRLLPLLLRGDEPVDVRCAAVSMVVRQGVAHSQRMVLDTTRARIEASGAIDLARERFALELEARPKQPSLLSLRGPLRVGGTFREPRVGVSADTLLRGGAAAALAAVNPLAALLPLIETGPGEDVACPEVLQPVAPALRQARRADTQPPRTRTAQR